MHDSPAMCGETVGTRDAVRAGMRALLFMMAIPLTATANPDDVDQRTLSADQVERYASVYYSAIRSCYFEHGLAAKTATGELSVKLTVHRDGYVKDVAVEAPGVRGQHLRKLTRCIRPQVVTWHFPVRRDFTTAILPYYFLSLNLPGAGPQYSCWNPRGCGKVIARR